MSEQHGGPAVPPQETLEPGGHPDRPERGGRRRATLIAATAALTVVVLGGAALAAVKLGAGGTQPTEALPDSTLAVVTLDLDPGAGQKVEAIKTLRKFPQLKKDLDLGSQDDLRRYAFEKIVEGQDCGKLSYAKDVEPWIGDRVAVAAVAVDAKTVVPVLALQADDTEAARRTFEALDACTGDRDAPGTTSFAEVGDYLLVSDGLDHAATVAAAAAAAPLAEDGGYRDWSGKAGDPGIVNFYVSRKATSYLSDAIGDLTGGGTGLGGAGAGAPLAQDPGAALREQLKSFTGLAGSLRFADGGLELEAVSGGAGGGDVGQEVGARVRALPDDTAAALAIGVPQDAVQRALDRIGAAGPPADQLVTQAESSLGLDLPGDVQTLLGKALTLSLGGKAPSSPDDISSLADLPLGLTVAGDTDAIDKVIAKVEERSGTSLDDAQVVTRSKDGVLALASSSDYADALLQEGALGDQERFSSVLPEADRSAAMLYLDFDSAWRDLAVEAASAQDAKRGRELDANTAPLAALGLSAWVEGKDGHLLFKVTTD